MKQLPESRLLAIVALGVACFSAGFSLTASAYASLGHRNDGDEIAALHAASSVSSAPGDRSCARR